MHYINNIMAFGLDELEVASMLETFKIHVLRRMGDKHNDNSRMCYPSKILVV